MCYYDELKWKVEYARNKPSERFNHGSEFNIDTAGRYCNLSRPHHAEADRSDFMPGDFPFSNLPNFAKGGDDTSMKDGWDARKGLHDEPLFPLLPSLR